MPLCCTLVLLETGLESFPGFANLMAITVLTRNIVDTVRLVLFHQGVLRSDQLSSDRLSWTVRDLYPEWREEPCCSFGDLVDVR